MLESAMEPRSKLTTNIRPLKIAYFVRDTDSESLERILRLACTQWGGQRHVLVPVTEDLTISPTFEYFLRINEPDQFVNFVTDATNDDVVLELEPLRQQLRAIFPVRGAINIHHGPTFETYDATAHSLHMFTAKDANRDLPSFSVLSHFSNNRAPLPDFKLALDELGVLCQLGLYGAIFPGQEGTYAEVFNVQPVAVETGSEFFWSTQLSVAPFSSILNLTTYGIRPHFARGHRLSEGNHLDVVLVNSPVSLCLYWNLRGLREATQFMQELGRRTLLLPTGLLTNEVTTAQFISFARGHLPYPGLTSNPHLWFHTADPESTQLLSAVLSQVAGLEKLRASKSVGVARHWDRFKPPEKEDLRQGNITYLCVLTQSEVMRAVLPESYLEGFGRPSQVLVDMSEGKNEVKLGPPPDFHNQSLGALVIDLESDIWARYPKDQRVAEVIRTGSWFSKYGISMQVQGLPRSTYLSFNLPSEWESLSLYFATKGYSIRASKAGQYGAAVVRLVGGIQSVEIFAQKSVYLLLDILALRSTTKIAQKIVKAIGRDDFLDDVKTVLQESEVIPELQGVSRTYQQLRSDERLLPYRGQLLSLLSSLSQKQILKRGFYLPCPQCGAQDWYPLQALHEDLTCTGCFHVFMLPVERSPGAEITWQYRLNTLVNRAVDQDVLPPILALYHLTKDRPCTCLALGIEVLRGEETLTDLDFLFVSGHQLFGGECKAGTELGQKDLDTACLAAELGFVEFSFCTVKTFSDETLKRLDDLRVEIETAGFSMKISVLSESEMLGEALSF